MKFKWETGQSDGFVFIPYDGTSSQWTKTKTFENHDIKNLCSSSLILQETRKDLVTEKEVLVPKLKTS